LLNDAGGTVTFAGAAQGSAAALGLPVTNNGTITVSQGQLNVNLVAVGASGVFNEVSSTALMILTGNTPSGLVASGFTSSGAGTLQVLQPLVLPSSTSVSGLASLVVQYPGSLTAASGSVVSLAAGVTQLAPGSSSGALSGPGQFTVPVGKLVKLGGQFTFTAGVRVVNNGQVEVMSWGGYDTGLSSGSVLENGSGATVILDESARLNAVSSSTGSLLNDAGGTVTFAGAAQGSAAALGLPVTNNGTITVSQGTLSVPSLALGATSTIGIGVANATGPFSSFGQLALGNPVSLTGTLAIQTAGGYLPANFTTFSPVHGGTESGTFTSVTGAQLAGVHWVPSYAASGFTLTAMSG
jgi:hypothetical protein